jgi:lipopolysaccharide export system protein LptA
MLYVALATALAPVLLPPAKAQVSSTIGTVGEFTATGETYGPPHEQQPRWRLSGREAELLEGGRYRLKEVQLEFYRPTGEREAWVAAPECIHDAARGRAHAAGPMKIESGDARAAIEGEGFQWEQATATLTISNRVRATLQRALTNPPPAPLVITSRWFVFEITNRRAVFHEQVRGEDAEFEFTCGRLTVQSGGTNVLFDLAQAEEGLAIREKATGRRVTADRAIYTRADERAELLGDVTWTQPDQSGKADRLVFDRAQKSVLAEGRVALRLLAVTFGLHAMLTRATNASAVELLAERVFSQTNFVLATGRVRLQAGTNDLACDRLVATLDSARQAVDTAVAEGNVRVERSDGSLRAERAEFVRAANRVVFTGRPEWSNAEAQGSAARLIVNPETGEFTAEEEVTVTLPLRGQSGGLLALFPEGTSSNAAPQTLRVLARALSSGPGRATFSGSVRAHQLPVSGDEPRLACDTLELQFGSDAASTSSPAPAPGRLERITARGGVVCEQGRPGVTNGPAAYRRLAAQTLTALAEPVTGALTSLHAEGAVVIEQSANRATGGRAVYQAQTGVLELTDAPELETPEVQISGARSLLWDRTHNRYAMSGPFRARIKTETARELAEKVRSP